MPDAITGNYNNMGTNIESGLSSTDGKMENAINKACGSLSSLEDDYMTAVSGDESNPNVKALMDKYGVTNTEGLQGKIQIKLQKAMRTFTALNQMIENMHQLAMRVINAMKV